MVRKTASLTALVLVCQLLCGSLWYKENLAFGLRDSILLFLCFSQSNDKSLYLTTTDGYVFSSHNGGASWNEARLIVKGKPFFGAIRPAGRTTGAPVSAEAVLQGCTKQGHGRRELSDALSFDFGTTGVEFLDKDDRPSPFDAATLPGIDNPGSHSISDEAGSIGGGSDAKLGVALKTGSPRLKGALRSKGLPSVNMNLQQLLVEMGVEPTWVNHIDVHPADHKKAVAATSMGTYMSNDGGIGWLPMFAGTDKYERDGQAVRFDPVNHDIIYLGTQSGLFISDNGGNRFTRVSGTQLEGAYVTWIEPVVTPDGKVWVYVGSTIGGFLSKDQGQTWRWIFFETLPDTNWVRSIAVDAQDPGHVLFSTYDGVFVTFDEGRNWDRSGGLMFTNTYLPRILADPKDGKHAIGATERNIWETRDGGLTWSVIYMDNGDWIIRNIAYDPHEEGTLWVVTSGELLRLRQTPPVATGSGRIELFKSALAMEPREYEVFDATFKNFGVDPAYQTRLRNKATLKAMIPEVRLVGGYFTVQTDAHIDVLPWKLTQGVNLDNVYERVSGYGTAYVGVMLWWDLREVLFDFDQMSFGRTFGTAVGRMSSMKFEVARYYNERIRLMRVLIVDPPEDLMNYMEVRMRFQELTEHLNALTGGLYESFLKKLKEGGVPWLAGY